MGCKNNTFRLKKFLKKSVIFSPTASQKQVIYFDFALQE